MPKSFKQKARLKLYFVRVEERHFDLKLSALLPKEQHINRSPSMALDTRDTKDVCSVSFYQSMIQQLPDQVELPVTSSSRSDIEQTPLKSHPESRCCVADTRTNQRETYSKNMSRESVAPGEKMLDDAKYLYISDSSCTEASRSSHTRRNRRYQKKVSSRSSRQVANHCRIAGDVDSSDCTEDCGEHGISESSSDAEFDGDGSLPPTHKLKMKKWKTLAKGNFEEMLLECIVDTGELLPPELNARPKAKLLIRHGCVRSHPCKLCKYFHRSRSD